MPKAIETIRRMRGGAQSHLMRCNDGFFYVVKPRNNPQTQTRSERILANEMLGSRLAARLGLPVPPSAVVEVSQELIGIAGDLRIQQGQQSTPWQPGPHYGSRYPGDPGRCEIHDVLPDAQLRQVENLTDFLGILCADKLCCNVNGRQAIFLPSPAQPAYRAVFVDQGFYFGAADWKFPDAPLRGLYSRHCVYQAVRGLDSFEPWLARIDKLTVDELGGIASEIPLEWYGGEADALEQLIEELDQRRAKVRGFLLEARNSPRQPFAAWS
jgi:hypothetical protein